MSTQVKNNAKLFDPTLLIQAGINPKTGLPYKMAGCDDSMLLDTYTKCFRIKDEQDAINRFVWYNLPNGLNSRLIERILYYRGQGMFFYMKENQQFYFLPYTLQSPDDGPGIDVYGRYRGVTPLPFNGSTQPDKKEVPWITGLVKKPVYDIPLDVLTLDFLEDSCVLLKDYSEQLAQRNLARQQLQDPLLQSMAEIPCMARTALLNSTGVLGIKVGNEGEASQVYAASQGLTHAALTGRKYIPIIGSIEFQELSGDNVAKAEEFLITLESLDNIRQSFYGIPNGGIFQKKAHMLETEAQMNAGAADLALQDSLSYRQDFCDLVNSIWGLGIDVDINPSLLGTQMMIGDIDGDGYPMNEPDEQVQVGMEVSNNDVNE